MSKTPIALIIDDPAPRVHVFYEHAETPFVGDGRRIVDNIPNSFLNDFCDVVEKHGIKGKYSVVPIPGGRGRIDEGIAGFGKAEIDEWVDIVKKRLTPYFSFCPELLTHKGWIDLSTMQMQDEQENDWSFRQTAETLTPYISLALQILKNVGIDATGVTSPWDFGVKNEDEYAKAIALAMDAVHGRKESWYFCRSLNDTPNARPWIAYRDDSRVTVAIPGTITEFMWQTMDTTECSDAYISSIADIYITADGKSGKIPEVLNTNGWPIMTTHWQSQFSNGLCTGLKVLDTIASRVNAHLSDRVQWMTHEEIMHRALNEL